MAMWPQEKIRPLPPGWRWMPIVDTSAPVAQGEPLPVFWTAVNDELQITSTDPWSHAEVVCPRG